MKMKRLLILLCVLLSVTACASTPRQPGAPLGQEATSPYQLLVSSSDLAPGPSRLALTLWDGPNRLTGAQALDLVLYSLDDSGETGEKVWEGPATGYSMGDTQYWVAFPDFPAPGIFGVQAVLTDAEGKQVENRALLQVKEAAEAPAVGQVPPRSTTRTLADAPVEELTSAGPYDERFYQLNVADAIASGKPSVVVFATPGHCTSSLCAPVMETARKVAAEVGDTVNLVHVEIYRDFAANELDPAVTEWNLPSEPWVFVLNKDGVVSARLDGLVGEEELLEAVREVADGSQEG